MWVLYRDFWLSWELHTTKEHRGFVTYSGRYPPAPTTDKLDRTKIVFRTLEQIQTLCSVLLLYCGNYISKLCNGQTSSFGTLCAEEKDFTNMLKNVLISPPVNMLPNSAAHMTLWIDTCHFRVGYVVFQQQPDETVKWISSRSRSLTDAEHKYDTFQRECFTIVVAATFYDCT